MKKQYVIAIILVILLVFVGFGVRFFVWENDSANNGSADFDANNIPALPDRSGIVATYTMAEISSHNSDESCWTVIESAVYDVTAWIDRHPGGRSAILSLCGKDGTSAFQGQHAGDDKPREQLANFFIGTLKSAQPDGAVN